MTAKEQALNLRKSNFTFGYDQKTLHSNYHQNFAQAPDILQHMQDMKSIMKDESQKTNIKIDSGEGQRDHYKSMQKISYPITKAQQFKLTDVI